MSTKVDYVAVEQENYIKFYHYAMERFAEGKDEEGKRAIICAVGTLLNIGARVADDIRPTFVDKAKRLLEHCTNLANKPYETLFGCIEDEQMALGLKIEDVPKELIEAKKTKELDRVAGLEEAKEEITRKVIYPIKYPTLFKRYDKETGGGILLYGLPGTGKTMIARAISKDVDAEFISVKCSDLLSKWFGESEVNIKSYFDKARKSKRAILFFDEFEAIGGKRTGSAENAMNRVVPELLAQMQGIETEENTVVCIAATNRPWDIDSAFLRSGRFGSKVYVPLPDGKAREQIVRNALANAPKAEDVSYAEIASKTAGYNGADMHELCEAAKIFAIEREIKTRKRSSLSMEDILRAINEVRSSVMKEDIVAMDRYRKQTITIG